MFGLRPRERERERERWSTFVTEREGGNLCLDKSPGFFVKKKESE